MTWTRLLFATGSPLWWFGLAVVLALRCLRYELLKALAFVLRCQMRWPGLYPLWWTLWKLGRRILERWPLFRFLNGYE